MKVVEIDHLSKSFGERTVLKDISFSVQDGEVFGYLGPNGAGKTTTMRVLLGLLRPSAGTAHVKGADLATDDAVRGSVGVLMENDGLYDRISATHNLDYYGKLYGVKDREQRITDLLRSFELYDRREDKVFTFSKGMRRKLGIARAIIHDPEILILDEPTSGLDPEAQKMVRDVLTELSRRERMTVLLSSHNLDEVQKTCTRVAVIKAGELRACDSVENLRAGGETHSLTITLTRESDVAAALATLNVLPSVIGVKVEGPVITVNYTADSSSSLLRSLHQEDILIEEARKTSRSLEDVYIDLVKGMEESA
jgi:ABC-2 type transport system ATP-binding protein